MTRKHRRLIIVLACGAGLGSASALALNAFSSSIVYFMAPSDIAARAPAIGHPIRLGGLVKAGSLHRELVGGEPTAAFTVTDGKHSVPVIYTGILPDLFREGQGVVAMGALEQNHVFKASEVLAKHDETYMPKDVADALKKAGMWNPAKGPAPPASEWNSVTTASARTN
jgi:cytochrome c-type biogenesis protein CcmE